MRVLWFAAAAVVLFGCNKQKLAPDEGSDKPSLSMATDGLWQDMGPVEVDGFTNAIESVTVNGASVPIEGDGFVAEVGVGRGVTLIEAIGTDARGDTYFARQGVLAGEFQDPNPPISDALTIRLNRSGLQEATDLVGGLIDPVALTAGVTALNPIYQDAYGVFGWDAVTIQADLVDIGFDPLIITSNPSPGVLAVEVVIPNIEVLTNATGEVVAIDFDQDVYVGADNAIITADLTVGVVNGQLDIQLIDPVVQLDGFWYDVSLLPGDIESFILVDTIRSTIEDMLVAKMDEMLPALLADTLGGLDISFDLELLGTQISIAATFADASIDAQGIQLTTDIMVNVPPAIDKPWVGYLGAPAAPAAPPMLDDIGLSVSDNLLNNTFFQVWRGGMLSLDLDSERGELEPVLLAQLGATNAARVKVDANLPPVLIDRDGKAQVQLTELDVRIDTPGGDNGEYIDLSVTAFIELELSIVDGNLTLELGTPDLILDVRDSDWGASNNSITNLLADQLPIGALLLLLGDIEFPLPSLAGISVNSGDAWRESSGVYTTVAIDL